MQQYVTSAVVAGSLSFSLADSSVFQAHFAYPAFDYPLRKFSPIQLLVPRKTNGMTQEELAAICNVSRQSISKWEADIALPETEKLLILGDTFRVSMDILLKDELTLNEFFLRHSICFS